jgi:diadenosine tetraphosphate (Ap4A) HIT family hydrolase
MALGQACVICSRQSLGGSAEGEVVYMDESWVVRHSSETNLLGYLLVESRRHILDLSQADACQASTYGPLLSSVMKAMRAVLPCERIYTFTLAEAVPHFHVHVIPRTATLPKAFRGRGILSYPLQPGPDKNLTAEICARLRRALRVCLVR